MSELQNPLFDEEKEFLERKKLEYERALRGDVDHIKDQSVMVGKIAMVGAGLAGGIWLITKIFGGKKRKRRFEADAKYQEGEYYTASNGKRYKSKAVPKSAADSASAFMEHHEQAHEVDDLGFGSRAATYSEPLVEKLRQEPSDVGRDFFEEDPFQDLPYDDSRRLPISHAFDSEKHATVVASVPAKPRPSMVGAVLKAFLQSDTGKVLVAQTAAVALAMVTKKVGEFFPADKNSDLAASPAHADDNAGAFPAASSAPSVPSDASNPPQYL